MKILVTGNLGYIGSVLTTKLEKLGYDVKGIDVGYFKSNLVTHTSDILSQLSIDIRDISKNELKDIDAIIHLASLSNDPLGEFNKKLTEEINNLATVRLAQIAKESGVKRFIYASSQSIYGIANTSQELNEDDSIKNPVSAYAIAKWASEQAILKMNDENFTVCAFRPATVFGPSPRFRCDIVYNNLMSCAYSTNKIEIFSDGTPCRPIVHIDDVCDAFISGLKADEKMIGGEAFNVGVKDGNYTVKQIAEKVRELVKGSSLVFTGKYGKDERTYKVSFNKIYNVLGEYYKPRYNLDNGGEQLLEFIKKIKMDEKMFRGANTNRLKQLKILTEKNLFNSDLRKDV